MSEDTGYCDGLALYVRLYSRGRADAGAPMSMEEIIGGLVGVIATAIEQAPSASYRAKLIEATHRALNDRMIAAHVTSETIN